MKTYKDLFEKICSFENLHSAYLKARKCKRYRDYILKFTYNLEGNLLKLQEELLNQTYQHGDYRKFVVCDLKKRQIKAAPFRDRVIHHALCNIVEPIFDKGFIYNSYACREEKGTHQAVKRLEKFLKSVETHILQRKSERDVLLRQFYCLQCDISKYFDSVNHQILFDLLKKKIQDQRVLWLSKIIIESSDKEQGKGIPIGNLTSQIFANVYLNELDQFVKHKLKQRYYIRYMDDFLILSSDKKNLRQVREQIQEFLRDKLKLEMNFKKVNIFPSEKGIDFLGYRTFKDYTLLRKSTVKRFIRRTKLYQRRLSQGLMSEKKFNNSLQSWLGYAKQGNSWRLQKDLFKRLGIIVNFLT